MKFDILKNRYYLYITEFFAGMAVMAVELGASRLLAPYFSSSQIVWTIIIGTIMIAMALGNVAGGKWADKDADPARLFKRILISAVWIAFIPVLGKYIILAITGIMIVTVSTGLLIWSSLAACMVIFVFPLFLLGTVTPSLIKYTISDIEESGSVAGRLGACNTIGSIIGTFLPTFVTIPSVGTGMTFLIFSGILLVIGLLFFISRKAKPVLCTVSTVLYIIACIFGHTSHFAFWISDLTYEGESVYNYLQVTDTEYATSLSTNVLFGVQSIKMKTGNLTGMYYDYALAAPTMALGYEDGDVTVAGTDKPDILILGMGTGTFAVQCEKYFPGCNITGVEIDEKITELAHTYFDLPEDINVYTYDGRAFLEADAGKYDVILVDAYQDITIPFQMSSSEFFNLVKDHLKENGIMVMNMNMHGNGETDITTYLSDTVASVFPNVATVNVIGSTNRELFASVNVDLFKSLEYNADFSSDDGLTYQLGKVMAGLTAYEGTGLIFTDDKAPVELLGMEVIDTLINDEIGYYKEIYQNEGLNGLIESL
ncbi:MAG: fused MFS/spermidine synthase [Lachnospiraceae bacterium]|nr:fused MFS/spermidine synthase [Lachnospiraceae bacterium]MBP3755546.1 fused MFS/spermidine synthase [Lachnospiraceae bacterium]